MKEFHFDNILVTLVETDNTAVYKFNGSVTESFLYQNVEISIAPRVVFDLEDIQNFNSCGIREWIYFVAKFEDKESFEFTNCAVPVVDQINMVPDTQGAASIKSFFAPYFCEEEEKPTDMLVNVQDFMEDITANAAPEFKCHSCKKELIFDALESAYFSFIRGNYSNTA